MGVAILFLNDLSSRIYVPNKTEDVNLNVFTMITRLNESKRIIKHISCKSRCNLVDWKRISDQKWNTINVNVSIKNQWCMWQKLSLWSLSLSKVIKLARMMNIWNTELT